MEQRFRLPLVGGCANVLFPAARISGIVFVDEAVDGGLEIDDGMEDAVLEPTSREFCEEIPNRTLLIRSIH